MNTLEIRRALQDLPTLHKDVFAADDVPIIWPRPVAYVFNCDKRSQPGSHWVAVFVDSLGHGVFFDSYGLPPIIPQHRRGIRENCVIYRWNTRQLQSDTSSLCGAFCIYFLFHMSLNNDLDSFCNIFKDNLNDNDRIVKRYLDRIKKKHVIDTLCANTQKCRARHEL